MPQVPTIRSLARQLRVSTATVSEALRDSPRVNVETRARVHRAAERVGYRPNPLLGAALSAVRRACHHHYRGNLALIDTAENGRTDLMLFHREIVAGASERAKALGFNAELFWLGEGENALPASRLGAVLRARGITGVVLLPFNVAQDLSDFDFSGFSAVQMDHCLIHPQLHTILPDHYVSMLHALERLTQRGYTRIGLCMERRKDVRLKNKWSAAFLAFFSSYARDSGIPALIVPELTRRQFLAWFQNYRPDLIVGHQQVMVDWLRERRVRVPNDVGFFNLNVTERTGPCAGLDLAPRRLGGAAIETVVAMLHRQERGVPEFPQTTTLEAGWIEGPTVRGSNDVVFAAGPGAKTALDPSGSPLVRA
jgi:LacI family transcriptional regulator